MVVVRDERGCGDTVEREKGGEKDNMSSKWYELHQRELSFPYCQLEQSSLVG